MPKYRVYGEVTGTKYLGVFEAESESEAIEKAMDSHDLDITLCHSCDHEVDGLEVTGGVAEPIEDADA